LRIVSLLCTALPTLGIWRFSIRGVLCRVAPFSSKILADRRKNREKTANVS